MPTRSEHQQLRMALPPFAKVRFNALSRVIRTKIYQTAYVYVYIYIDFSFAKMHLTVVAAAGKKSRESRRCTCPVVTISQAGRMHAASHSGCPAPRAECAAQPSQLHGAPADNGTMSQWSPWRSSPINSLSTDGGGKWWGGCLLVILSLSSISRHLQQRS